MHALVTRFFDKFIEPVSAVEGLERRRSSRMFAGLLLVIVVLGIATGALHFLFFGLSDSTLLVIALIIAGLTVAWLLARTGRYELGVVTSIIVILAGLTVLIALIPNVIFSLFFMIIAVMLAGTFLPMLYTFLTAIAAVSLVALVLYLLPERAPLGNALAPIMFLIIVSAAIMLARYYRDQMERVHQRHLLESDRRYQLAIEAAHEGIWEWDIQHMQTYLSLKALAIIGHEKTENTIASELWQKHIHPDDLPAVSKAMTEYLSGEGPPYDVEHRMITDDGREIWIHSRGTVVSDNTGAPVKVVGTFTDITEKKKVAENIRKSEVSLKQAQRIAHVGDWTWDLVTSEVTWSDEMYRIHGVDLEEKTDDVWGIMQERIHPDDMPRVQAVSEESMKGDSKVSIEYRLVQPDGSITHVLGQGESVFDAEGKMIHRIGTVKDITDIKRAEQALLHEKNFVSAILQSANSLLIVLDKAGRIIRFNRACEKLTGYSFDDISGKFIWDTLLETKDIKPVKQIFNDLRTTALPSSYKNNWVTKDGRKRMIEWSNSVITGNEEGSISFIVAIGNDITERVMVEAERDKHARALDQSADSVMITDRNGVIEYVNPACENITGYAREELIGQNPRIVNAGKQDGAFYHRLWETILAGRVFRDVLINRAKDGSLYYEEKTIAPLLDSEGKVTSFVSTGKDITERVATQERMYYLAHHDVLTDLPNRILFLERLGHALTGIDRRDQLCAILFLDLDRFKNINDTLGHDIGDKLLQAVGERLKDSVREGDTVARLGGDEFTVLLENIQSADAVAPVARKVLAALATPFQVDDHELYSSASIGISMYPDDGSDPKSLLKNADTAMYRAKDQGRNTYQYYSAEMGARVREYLTLETGLRHALDRNEFELYYQQLVDITDGVPFGAEALLRWRHPEHGLVSPGDFIPLLEDTGLIVAVGEWVVDQACRQVMQWLEQGLALRRMSINLSSRQFDELDFLDNVLEITRHYGVPAGLLEFEITESLLLRQAHYTVDVLQLLNKSGIRIAIDDFGTGYSSLSYLKRYPISTLKIDRSFVRDVTADPGDAEIVKAILAMARSLNLDVIAEGVETRKQEEFLSEAGCRSVQGYLYAKPCTATEFLNTWGGQKQEPRSGDQAPINKQDNSE
ncbi:MAG: EAL domain-containing protein [Acidiferrobacterales bacterium]